jgi:hypothetical protein
MEGLETGYTQARRKLREAGLSVSFRKCHLKRELVCVGGSDLQLRTSRAAIPPPPVERKANEMELV